MQESEGTIQAGSGFQDNSRKRQEKSGGDFPGLNG